MILCLMKDVHLREQWSALSVPKADPIAKDRALHRALVAFKQSHSQVPAPVAPWFWRRMTFALVTVALLAGVFGFWLHRSSPDRRGRFAMMEITREIETLFPKQINAIVEENGEIRLDLAFNPDALTDQPVYVQLVHEGHTIRVVSYSGRRITVTVGQEKLTFEPLVTGSGEVILVGEDFLWSPAHPAPHGRFRVLAYPLLPS